MPELAEVEYARKLTEHFLVNRKITKVTCDPNAEDNVFSECRARPASSAGPNAGWKEGSEAVKLVLTGGIVVAVRRKGKNLVLFVYNAAVRTYSKHAALHVLHVHFGMTGQFFSRKLSGGNVGKYGIQPLLLQETKTSYYPGGGNTEQSYLVPAGQGAAASSSAVVGAAASSSAVVVSKGVAASSSGSSSSANSNVTSNKGWKKRSSIQLPSSSEEADKSFGPGDFNPAKSAAKINPDPPAGSAPFLNKSKIHQENKEKMALDTQWPPRFSKLLLETRSLKDSSDVDEYSYDDTRKFGYVYVLNLDRDFVAGWDFEHCKASGVGDVDLLWPNLEFVARMKKDPFTELPSLAEFEHLLENLRWKSSSGEKKVPSPLPIKTLLLDQEKVLCGLGNWLVDDVLFDCGIHPNEFVDEILKARKAAALRTSISSVVTLACDVDADADRFPKHWLFHSRWTLGRGGGTNAEKCAKVEHFGRDGKKSKLEMTSVGQRTTILDQASQVLSKPARLAVKERERQAAAKKKKKPSPKQAAAKGAAKAGPKAGKADAKSARPRAVAKAGVKGVKKPDSKLQRAQKIVKKKVESKTDGGAGSGKKLGASGKKKNGPSEKGGGGGGSGAGSVKAVAGAKSKAAGKAKAGSGAKGTGSKKSVAKKK